MTMITNDSNRNLPPFIGLWSPAPGCGKSTVAHYLGELQPGYSDDSGHRSEAGLGDIPIARTIVNDGTLSELRRKVGVMA
jgi:hypothetical protein